MKRGTGGPERMEGNSRYEDMDVNRVKKIRKSGSCLVCRGVVVGVDEDQECLRC
jgi:hypothetical protein